MPNAVAGQWEDNAIASMRATCFGRIRNIIEASGCQGKSACSSEKGLSEEVKVVVADGAKLGLVRDNSWRIKFISATNVAQPINTSKMAGPCRWSGLRTADYRLASALNANATEQFFVRQGLVFALPISSPCFRNRSFNCIYRVL